MKKFTLKNKINFALLILFLLSNLIYSQTKNDVTINDYASLKSLYPSKVINPLPELMEICDNNQDDDGDGLIDCDDPDCYFSDPDCECWETEIIWANDFGTLRWHNVFTGIGQTVGPTVFSALGDIAWSPTGQLYGCDLGGDIYELNHNTGQATPIASFNWSDPNSMVCDAEGNIIIAESDPPRRVLKYNPLTGSVTNIVNSTSPYSSAGDLAFVDETLYLLVNGPGLLEIDIATGNFNYIQITGFSGAPWGIANNAQGQLFLSIQDDFYELNPTTGVATFLSTANDNDSMRGLSMLGDYCESIEDSLVVSVSGNEVICDDELADVVLTIETTLDNLEFNWEAVPSGDPFGWGDFPVDSNPYDFTIEDLPVGNYSITLTDGINVINTEIIDFEVTFDYSDVTNTVYETTCDIFNAGTFEDVYPSQFGCDSTVITIVTYIPPDNEFINLTSCNPADTGIFVNNFINQFGCDSTEVITIEYALADTTYSTEFVCLESDTGMVIQSFTNQFGCDSLEITLMELAVPDSTFLFEMSCFESDTGLVIQNFDNQIGCDSFVFINTELITIEADLNPIPISCFSFEDGQIEISNPNGGTTPYMYSIDGINFQNEAIFQNLVEGQYEITIQDANGCENAFLTTINSVAELQIELGENLEIELGDSIQIPTFVNNPNISNFIWTNSETLGQSDELRPFASPLETTTYQLTVFLNDDCFVLDEITIFVNTNRRVYIPNAFSPNNDGINDNITIYGNHSVEAIEEFLIFDRWGELVFENVNFPPNDSKYGWNGMLDGKIMKPAVFAYMAKVRFLDGHIEILKGDLVLMR